jgi:hypothetical protein
MSDFNGLTFNGVRPTYLVDNKGNIPIIRTKSGLRVDFKGKKGGSKEFFLDQEECS